MRRREQSRVVPSHREDISILLEVFGLGPVEQKLVHVVSGIALFFSRLKVRVVAGMIPTTVILAIAAYAAGAVALAVRKERASGGR